MKKKYGWTVWGLLGLIFAPMGLLFLVLGVALWSAGAGQKPEDPIIFLAVFGGIGVLFLLIGLLCLGKDLRRRARQRRAYEGGYYVMAQIAGVKANRNVNGPHGNPYMLECHYTDPDTGVAHVWYSRYLYTDVTDLLKSDEVPVYTDRYDYSVGFVDVDAILPEIRVHG